MSGKGFTKGFLVFLGIFVLASGILWSCDQASLRKKLFCKMEEFPDDHITSIVIGKKAVFVGLKDNGVVAINDDQIVARSTQSRSSGVEESEPENRIKALAIDAPGENLWVGAVSGLYQYDPQNLSRKTEFHAGARFADNIIQTVSERKGTVAIGTTKGLSLSTKNWDFLTDREGLPSIIVNAVEFSSGTHLLAGTTEGMSFYEGGVFKPAILPGQWINDLCYRQPLFADVEENQLKIVRQTMLDLDEVVKTAAPKKNTVKPEDAEQFTTKAQALMAEFLEMLNPEKSSDDFFVGTNEGVYLLKTDGKPPEKILEGWTLSLAVDPGGTLYAGQRGLKVLTVPFMPGSFPSFNLGALIRAEAIGIFKKKFDDMRRKAAAQAAAAGGGDVPASFPAPPPEPLPSLVASGWADIFGNEAAGLERFASATEAELDGIAPENEEMATLMKEWKEFQARLNQAEITALAISHQGEIWVGTNGVGLFRFQPILANAEIPIFSHLKKNEYFWGTAGWTPIGSGTPGPATMTYFHVGVGQPKIAAEVMTCVEGLIQKFIPPFTLDTFQWWVGHWSQLKPEDRKAFLKDFVAAYYGDFSHFDRFARLFLFDPYLALAIAPGKEVASGTQPESKEGEISPPSPPPTPAPSVPPSPGNKDE